MKTFVVACTKQHQAVVHGVVGGGTRWTAPAFDCPCRFLAQYATATPTMRRLCAYVNSDEADRACGCISASGVIRMGK